MTLNSQYNVKEAFSKLDFQNSNKPSLDDYSSMVKGARNHSFHNLFKLNNTIEVDLEGVNIKAKRLTFFEEFKKTPNSFEFEDQQLINVLTEFNRTSEKFVPDVFWVQNLEVMKSIQNLVIDMCDCLKLLCLLNQ